MERKIIPTIEMKRLWIVTEFFWPDETATAYILTNIANRLVDQYEVHVISGPENTQSASTNVCPDERIFVHRTNHFNLSKDKLFQRVVRFICISIMLTWKLLWHCRHSDKVLVTTNPAPLPVIMALVKRLRGFELAILVHDIFPENAVPAGLIDNKHSLVYRCLKGCFDHAYAKADKMVVIGRDMEEVMRAKLERYPVIPEIHVITNWADYDQITMADTCNSERLIIQYAGNLGRVQGLMDFLSVFCEAANPDLLFSMWGSGAAEDTIKDYLLANPTENVELRGAFTRQQQSEIVGMCDMSLITLAEGMYGLGVPSKFYNIMAAGKPVLYIGPKDSEIWRMVSENGIGYCFSPSDRDGIISFLRSLAPSKRQSFHEVGIRAAKLAQSDYSRSVILDQFADFL